jgi:hypothetical protein
MEPDPPAAGIGADVHGAFRIAVASATRLFVLIPL